MTDRKSPFKMEDVQFLRELMIRRERVRDLALIEVGYSTLLRGGDLLSLRVGDVLDERGEVCKRFTLKMAKTGHEVTCTLTENARHAIQALMAAQGKTEASYLFTGTGRDRGDHLATRTLRDIVKGWAADLNLDPRRYSNHSLRRSRAHHIYSQTGNVEAVRQLLGHRSLAETMKYLGVEAEDALKLAEQLG